ncbi:hypothetical protein CK203_029065 [Vitis vinifera]|uniref:Uncharacterized protein n=1 Tax=Vitis vinifera TaxID=29760 RepID=A0A438IMZ9_VITVI|nr:hypothetical protein CK203_029065 [Vitis vinifera]
MKGEESSSKAEQGSKTKEAEARTQRLPRAPAETSGIPNTTSLHFGHGKDQRRPFRLPILTDTSTTSSRHGSRSFAPVQAPAIPPSEGEALLSADTPPGGHPRTLCHRRQPEPVSRPCEENQVLGSWRAIPRLSRAAYRGTSDSCGSSETRPSDSSQSSEIHSDCCRGITWSLLTPRQFYYPRVVIDFYQSMTTRGLRNPTLIQFTIDGRQGAIGARHIAEALRIPYEPVFQADFREWSSFSQSDMVRILSRGTSTASVLTRRELPSGMLLIDVLLRANLFPFSIKFRGEELYLRHYSGFLRAISSALII